MKFKSIIPISISVNLCVICGSMRSSAPTAKRRFCAKARGHMLCVSEIHSAVRSRVEQTHNICPSP